MYCSPDGQIKEALAERKVTFIPLESWSLKNLKKVIRETKPDIIHAHDMKASFYSAILCGDIPLISHIHNNNYNSRGFSIKSILFFYSAQKAKHIFWVSKSAYEGYAFHNRFKEKSSVLYNIIDQEELREKVMKDTRHYDYNVVFLGRLTYQKNPVRLISVLGMIANRYDGIKSAVIGTGELYAETEKEIERIKKQDSISMIGFKSNPYKMLCDAKVMIMTSRWEGLPMCALEAMSLGVPIVSTPTDGLKELIEDGVTGYLSDKDDVLAERIIEILQKEQLHSFLSENCIKKAEMLMNTEKYRKEIEEEYIRDLETE